jgi:hypothetical protein
MNKIKNVLLTTIIIITINNILEPSILKLLLEMHENQYSPTTLLKKTKKL